MHTNESSGFCNVVMSQLYSTARKVAHWPNRADRAFKEESTQMEHSDSSLTEVMQEWRLWGEKKNQNMAALIARLVVLHWWGTVCDTRATSHVPFNKVATYHAENTQSHSPCDVNLLLEWASLLFLLNLPFVLFFFLPSHVPVSKLWLSVVDVALRFQPRWVVYHFTLREPDKIRHVWKHLVSLRCLTLQSWACSHNGIIYPGCWWWSSRV